MERSFSELTVKSQQINQRRTYSKGQIYLLLIGLIMSCSVGCSDARMQRLCGKWKLDFSKSESIVDNMFDGESPEDSTSNSFLKDAGKAILDSAVKKAQSQLSQTMTLQFDADGTWKSETSFATAVGKKSGSWSVLSETGDDLTIQFNWTEPNSNRVETGKTTIRFVDHNTIRLVPPNISATEMELTYRRDPAK